MNSSTVSIGIITYNHFNFIAECLDSIRLQTYQDFEVIISDDCSKDDTVIIVENYLKKYPHFKAKFIKQERNLGITKNSNFVFQSSDSKYSIVFAGDDIMLPERLKLQVAALDSNPNASFCYSNCEWFNSRSGRKICNHFGLLQKPPKSMFDLISDFTIPTPTMMIRRSMVPDHGYDERLEFFSDFMMAVELWREGKPIFIPQTLVKYRKHSMSIMSTNLCIKDRETLLSIFAEKFKDSPLELEATENYRSIYYYALISDHIINNRLCVAFKILHKITPKLFSSVKWFVRSLKLLKDLINSLIHKLKSRYKHD